MTQLAVAYSVRACMRKAVLRWQSAATWQQRLAATLEQIRHLATRQVQHSAVLVWVQETSMRRHFRRCTAAAVAFYHVRRAPTVRVYTLVTCTLHTYQ